MTNKRQTLKEYLTEVDIGDHQLAQQAQRDRTARRDDNQARRGYNDGMESNNPNRGDIVIIKANKYIVQGGSMKGIKVKHIGGAKTGTIPHGTKFEKVGTGNNGNNIFKAILQ